MKVRRAQYPEVHHRRAARLLLALGLCAGTLGSHAQAAPTALEQQLPIVVGQAERSWWNPAFGLRYRLASSGTHDAYTAQDYLVIRNLPTAAWVGGGNLRADCGDLRVVYQSGGSSTELGRLVLGCNTAATEVYFKAQAPLPANANLARDPGGSYFLYLKNPSPPAATAYANSTSIDAPYAVDADTRTLWHADEGADNSCAGGSNDVCDAASTTKDGAFVGGATWAPGRFGTAISLDDAASQYVEVVDPASDTVMDFSGDFTVEAWVKFSSASCLSIGSNSDGMRIISKVASAFPYVPYYFLRRADSTSNVGDCKLELEIPLLTDVASTRLLNDTSWHHVAGTRQGSLLRVYIDGVLEGSKTGNANSEVNDGNLRLGRAHASYPEFMGGLIDEVRLSSVARTFNHVANPAVLSLEPAETVTAAGPLDGALGLVNFDPATFPGATLYFEGVASTDAVTFNRFRSSSLAVPGTPRRYTVRLRTGDAASTVPQLQLYDVTGGAVADAEVVGSSAATSVWLRSARLVVRQVVPTGVTATASHVAIAGFGSTVATGYQPLTDTNAVLYQAPRWSPPPAVTLEATLAADDTGRTAYAQLFAAGASCASPVAGSEISVTGPAWSLAASPPLTLLDGTEYMLCLRSSQGAAGLAGARLVFSQQAGGGITALETSQLLVGRAETSSATTYALVGPSDRFDPAAFAGTGVSLEWEAVLGTTGGVGYAQLWDGTMATPVPGTEQSSSAATPARLRSSVAPYLSSARELQTEIRNSVGGGSSTTVSASRLLVIIGPPSSGDGGTGPDGGTDGGTGGGTGPDGGTDGGTGGGSGPDGGADGGTGGGTGGGSGPDGGADGGTGGGTGPDGGADGGTGGGTGGGSGPDGGADGGTGGGTGTDGGMAPLLRLEAACGATLEWSPALAGASPFELTASAGEALPAGLSLAADEGMLRFAATRGEAGVYRFEIVSSDGARQPVELQVPCDARSLSVSCGCQQDGMPWVALALAWASQGLVRRRRRRPR